MKKPPASLQYHRDLANLLEQNEKDLWDWFSSDKFTSEAYEIQRLYLLKNSYRLETEAHAELYSQAQAVATQLGLDIPITLYQSMKSDTRNAGLIFQPDVIQILFSGDLFGKLSNKELEFILGHEMAHHLHNTRQSARFGTADRLLDWICGEPGASASHGHSFRLSRLYQEIFSDRIGLFASQDLDASISALVRLTTGLESISPKAYLKQADEALASSSRAGVHNGSEEWSHPETFIRVRALSDWSEEPDVADSKLATLVEGDRRIESLDLLAQDEMSGLTRLVVTHFLKYPWRNREALIAHAQGFFVDIETDIKQSTAHVLGNDVTESMKALPVSLKEYMAYVLLDFATLDSDLEDHPLIEAIHLADQLDIGEAFDLALKEDLKLSKANIKALRKTSSILEGAQQ
jgi:hypothetical protein